MRETNSGEVIRLGVPRQGVGIYVLIVCELAISYAIARATPSALNLAGVDVGIFVATFAVAQVMNEQWASTTVAVDRSGIRVSRFGVLGPTIVIPLAQLEDSEIVLGGEARAEFKLRNGEVVSCGPWHRWRLSRLRCRLGDTERLLSRARS
jgi:hypothetical protein